MWELLTWQQPWEADNINTFQILQFVLRDDLRPHIPPKEELPGEECPGDVLDDYICLVKECWDRDPSKRPSFQEIVGRLQHMRETLCKTKQDSKVWWEHYISQKMGTLVISVEWP